MLYTVFSVAASTEQAWNVGRIKLQGNRTFSSRELRSFMELKKKRFLKGSRFTKSRLQNDVRSIENFYASQGFFETSASVESLAYDTSARVVVINLQISEGGRTTVTAITVLPQPMDTLYPGVLKQLQLKIDKPLIQAYLQADEQQLRTLWAQKGYLASRVESRVTVDTTNQTAQLLYIVLKGPQVVVDSIVLEGVKGLKPAVIQRELSFKPGDTLSLGRVRKSEQKLYRTNLLSSVQIEPVWQDSADALQSDSTMLFPIRITIRETNFFRLKTGVGYGSADGARSSLETSYSNLFGVGHRLGLQLNVAQNVQEAKTVYSTPWFFGVPLRFDGTLYYNRFSNPATYNGLFRGILLSLDHYIFALSTTLQFWTKYEDAFWISQKDLPADYPQKNTQSFGLNCTYDTRNDMIDPKKGVYNLLKSEFAGITGANSNQFIKFTADTRIYWRWQNLQYGSALKLGWVQPYGNSSEVPIQDRFYAGGSRSVRGFKDDRLLTQIDTADGKLIGKSGTLLATANLCELRFPLFWWFSGALFADAGTLLNSGDISTAHEFMETIRWTVGPGLRAKTPIAVIRFDVGFKLNYNEHQQLAQWHLDVGYAF